MPTTLERLNQSYHDRQLTMFSKECSFWALACCQKIRMLKKKEKKEEANISALAYGTLH